MMQRELSMSHKMNGNNTKTPAQIVNWMQAYYLLTIIVPYSQQDIDISSPTAPAAKATGLKRPGNCLQISKVWVPIPHCGSGSYMETMLGAINLCPAAGVSNYFESIPHLSRCSVVLLTCHLQ